MALEDLQIKEILGQGLSGSEVYRATYGRQNFVVKCVRHQLLVNQAAIENFEYEKR